MQDVAGWWEVDPPADDDNIGWCPGCNTPTHPMLWASTLAWNSNGNDAIPVVTSEPR